MPEEFRGWRLSTQCNCPLPHPHPFALEPSRFIAIKTTQKKNNEISRGKKKLIIIQTLITRTGFALVFCWARVTAFTEFYEATRLSKSGFLCRAGLEFYWVVIVFSEVVLLFGTEIKFSEIVRTQKSSANAWPYTDGQNCRASVP